MPHIAIAGAGIGGLTAALALAKDGIRVTVLERRPGPAEFGAGVQLSPNATRILDRLGVLADIRAAGVEPGAVRVRRARDGADIVRFPLGAHAAERYGGPFLLVLRPTLQGILVTRAEAEAGIDLRFGVEVRGFATDGPQSVAAKTDTGPVAANGFVDARGVGSIQAVPSGRVAWRAMVGAEGLPPGERRPDTNLWLGPRAHLVHYPMPGGDRVNVVAVTQNHPVRQDAEGELWSRPADPSALRRAFRGWHADALRLLDPGATWRCWPLLEAAPLARWSDGPATRLGDAAHPMLPFLAQGASQAIEDAGSLAACLRQGGSVTDAFASYEARRRARATRVQSASRRQAEIYHLARPASDARDLALRLLGGARALGRMDWLYGG